MHLFTEYLLKALCVCTCVCVQSLQSCQTLCNPMDCIPPGSSLHGDSPGKNTGVGCHALLQGIFLTQGSNLSFLCLLHWQAATAAKSLQSCPTLCNPRDGSPPGSPVPGILQVRTLEWVAIFFSNAWKWKVKVKSLSRVLALGDPMDCSLSGSSIHGIFQARVTECDRLWNTKKDV